MPFDHLDEELTQRLLHGELTAALSAPVRDHLAACDECRQRVAAAERDEVQMLSMLRHLDDPSPNVSVHSIVDTARRRSAAPGRWAAGIILALGIAGTAYAAPRVLSWLRSPEPSSPPAVLQPSPSGIALAPGADLLIVFEAAQTQGEVTVFLSDGAEVVVRAFSGGAAFDAGEGRVRIENQGSSASFEIEIPRAAPHIEIRVADRQVFRKDGIVVTADAPSGTGGRFIIPLVR